MPYKSPTKRRAYRRAYERKNKVRLARYYKQYHKKNARRNVQRVREWRLAHPAEYRKQVRQRGIKHQQSKDEQVRLELRQQGHRCGLCQKRFTKKNPPVRDHCHRTGKRRALLHSNCNIAIGHLKDSPMLCMLAASYLRDWKHFLGR